MSPQTTPTTASAPSCAAVLGSWRAIRAAARAALIVLAGAAFAPAAIAQEAGAGDARVGDATRASSDSADEPDIAAAHDGVDLVESALIASGLTDPAERALYRDRLDEMIGTIVVKVGDWGSDERKARRLLSQMHRRALTRYDVSATGFAELVDSGVYNCVTATLLYMMAARRLDLDVVAAETPMHVYVVLRTPRRAIDIEVTTPRGYDVSHDLISFRRFVLANKYATAEEVSRRGIRAVWDDFQRLTQPVVAERVVALLYHNAGVRAMQAGDAVEAARNLVAAARIDPVPGPRAEDLRTTLAWAVREQYDAGRFAEALRLAETALVFFPDRTTVRDRLMAVGARVVEEAAGRGDIAAAEAIEARVLERLDDAADRRRVEATTSPIIARAAVAAGDWSAAARAAARFRAAYQDPIEAERFARWVEERTQAAAGPADGAGAAWSPPGRRGAFVAETRRAVAAAPAGQPDYPDVIEGIAALALQGRHEEALAVGRVQREALRGDAAMSALDALLKAITAEQVTTLLESHRWRDAAAAADTALVLWPGDADLAALRQRCAAARAEDPYRLAAWPEALSGDLPPVPAPGVAGPLIGPLTSPGRAGDLDDRPRPTGSR